MTEVRDRPPRPALPHLDVVQNPMLGIGLKVASVGFFLAMASFLKASEGIPPGELVFFRSFFAIAPILVFLALRRELVEGFKTARPWGHLWRGVVGVCGMGLGFFALTRLPLPEAVAINYAMPLLIVVFSAIFLGEQVRLYRWSAVLVGMAGVGIILWPRLSVLTGNAPATSGATIGALAALAAACVGAFGTLLVRKLVDTERSATIVVYFSITCSLISLMSLPFGWVWPEPRTLVFLISAGIAGGLGQILVTECYRYADMSVVAPFEYSSLVLSVIVGYLAFGDIPTPNTLFGSLVVIAAGIFIIYREHRLGLERRRAKGVTTPQG